MKKKKYIIFDDIKNNIEDISKIKNNIEDILKIKNNNDNISSNINNDNISSNINNDNISSNINNDNISSNTNNDNISSNTNNDNISSNTNNYIFSKNNIIIDKNTQHNNIINILDTNINDGNIFENNQNEYVDGNNVYLKELLRKQLKNIIVNKKLNYNDIKRISKFLSSSIFDKNKCSIWAGYVTNEKNKSKGTYINFYFNKKKIALHRLLYINYVEDISNNEYLKFSCSNKGKCCNVSHMKKYVYNKNIDDTIDTDKNIKDEQKQNNDKININTERNKLIVEL